MISFTKFLSEGSDAIPDHESIDKNVWMTIGSNEPILSDEIYKQIMMDVSDVQDIVMVEKVYLTGDMLTNRFLDDTNLDVFIVIMKDNVTPIAYERLMKFSKATEGKFAGHTRHLLKYHIELLEDAEEIRKFEASAPGVYDILKQKWLKIPVSSAKNIAEKVSMFISRISQIGLDENAKIDWDYFLNVSDENIEQMLAVVMSKAFEMDTEFKNDPEEVQKVVKKFAFGDWPDVTEIEKLYNKDKIPATLIQRLVARYYLQQYIDRLRDKAGKNKMTDRNELPPDGDTENRFDPFPRENVPESRTIPSFGEFVAESSLKKPYQPKGLGARASGVQRKLSNKSEVEKMTTGQDAKKKIVVNNGVMHGDALVDALKQKNFASVPLTDVQTQDIELKYGLSSLDDKNPFRRLGRTGGMAIVRKKPRYIGDKPGAILVKNKIFDGMSGGIKK